MLLLCQERRFDTMALISLGSSAIKWNGEVIWSGGSRSFVLMERASAETSHVVITLLLNGNEQYVSALHIDMNDETLLHKARTIH